MSDEKNYLFGGEEVVLVVRRHPIVLVKPIVFPFIGLTLLIGVPAMFTLLVFAIACLYFGWKLGLWWLDRFVLTTNRILSTSGIVTKSVVSMPLSKITDLTYARSLLGRILGYGRLHLESAGQVGLESIDHLPDPDHFYRMTMSLALGPPSGRAPKENDRSEGTVVQVDHSADLRNEEDSWSLVHRSDD